MKQVAFLLFAATPAIAGYSEHETVKLFTERPCAEALAVIQSEETTIEALARMGMAWGFLLGYDTASGGLDGPSETTLERLEDACGMNPEKTAAAILDSLR